jgi:hypothetical protein
MRILKPKCDKYKEDEMPPLENYSDVEYLVDKEVLVIRKLFNIQIKKDDK